jgi:hypothetical protein
MGVSLLKTLKHLFKQHILLPETRSELIHIRVWWLTLKPQLGVGANDMLNAVGEKQH